VPVPNQENEWLCVCVLVIDIDFASFYDFLLDFGSVLTVWYFFFISSNQNSKNDLHQIKIAKMTFIKLK
jgi:hypothetical protein